MNDFQFAARTRLAFLLWLPDLRCTCVGAFLPAQQLQTYYESIESSSGLLASYDGKGIVTEEYAEKMPYQYQYCNIF